MPQMVRRITMVCKLLFAVFFFLVGVVQLATVNNINCVVPESNFNDKDRIKLWNSQCLMNLFFNTDNHYIVHKPSKHV